MRKLYQTAIQNGLSVTVAHDSLPQEFVASWLVRVLPKCMSANAHAYSTFNEQILPGIMQGRCFWILFQPLPCLPLCWGYLCITTFPFCKGGLDRVRQQVSRPEIVMLNGELHTLMWLSMFERGCLKIWGPHINELSSHILHRYGVNDVRYFIFHRLLSENLEWKSVFIVSLACFVDNSDCIWATRKGAQGPRLVDLRGGLWA